MKNMVMNKKENHAQHTQKGHNNRHAQHQHNAEKNPVADIYYKDDKVFVELEMPAVEKDSIAVTLEKSELFISAESIALEGDYNLSYAEFTPARYTRKFRLGEELDKDSIEANYRNGVLTLSMKKATSVSRKIDVI